VPPKKQTKRPKTGKVTRLDKRLTQALNHPLRTEIIAILSDTCASPSEMADMLGEELSNVSYHTKQLLELDCIEVVDKKQVRGAVKTRYRATTKMLLDNPDWEKLGRTVRTGISINAVNEVTRRAADALEARLARGERCAENCLRADQRGRSRIGDPESRGGQDVSHDGLPARLRVADTGRCLSVWHRAVISRRYDAPAS
jgi:DNA-binding transcriptional ArsR family regulator